VSRHIAIGLRSDGTTPSPRGVTDQLSVTAHGRLVVLRRQDDAVVQVEAKRDGVDDTDDRLQRGDCGALSWNLIHRLGRRWPRQAPSSLETLLPKR